MRKSASVIVLTAFLAIVIASPALADQGHGEKEAGRTIHPVHDGEVLPIRPHGQSEDGQPLPRVAKGMPVDSGGSRTERTALHGAARHDDGKMLAQLLESRGKGGIAQASGRRTRSSAAAADGDAPDERLISSSRPAQTRKRSAVGARRPSTSPPKRETRR
ncbi:MAG: hypothetical protein M0C28_05185 [Candidatus Moduliflexus flocculans]|nr:hypothetical protein [Candidatus Moduliflexus flocculans]